MFTLFSICKDGRIRSKNKDENNKKKRNDESRPGKVGPSLTAMSANPSPPPQSQPVQGAFPFLWMGGCSLSGCFESTMGFSHSMPFAFWYPWIPWHIFRHATCCMDRCDGLSWILVGLGDRPGPVDACD